MRYPGADEGTWEAAFDQWLEPFLAALGHKARRKWAPLYLRGLLGPGDRKSIQPLALRIAPKEREQIHHFVAASTWETLPLEEVLASKADAMVGGSRAHLIIDDTALPKKGDLSVGVGHQYCGALGKSANCQALVSLTLATDNVPVPIALRLYLPRSWADDPVRRRRCGVPEELGFKPKWAIALEEIRRAIEHGVTFGDVLADAGYGVCHEFRRGLTEMQLTWAVGISPDQLVYPKSVRTSAQPASSCGRPSTRRISSMEPRTAREAIAALGKAAFQEIAWRDGTKGPLSCDFAAVRVRAADGDEVVGHRHGPGEEAWLVCERRANGQTKYYLSNRPERTPITVLAAAIKARWSCEQAHQQLKEELGLDHFEGRSWHGLHHHAVLAMISFAFLQHLRLQNKAPAQRLSA